MTAQPNDRERELGGAWADIGVPELLARYRRELVQQYREAAFVLVEHELRELRVSMMHLNAEGQIYLQGPVVKVNLPDPGMTSWDRLRALEPTLLEAVNKLREASRG